MSERLSVEEASAAYEGVMRNMARPGPGVCTICRNFVASSYTTCYRCAHQPDHLDVVVPITYSEHLGQMHTALRNYKDATGAAQRYAAVRVAAVLWRFLAVHERCIAREAGLEHFDLVTTVPSSAPERDERPTGLRTIANWCRPIEPRLAQLLTPTGEVPTGRVYDERRFRPTGRLDGKTVLLIDDTWATGGHAQSAAAALRDAGATRVALAVIGRHVTPAHELAAGDRVADRLAALPSAFDWITCAVHDTPAM